MDKRPTHPKLDEIAPPEAQKAWLVSPASEVVEATRTFPEIGEENYDDRLLYLVNQNRIEFTGASVKEIEELFSSDWVLRAARSVNLDLMQGGVLAFGWPRFHVSKLIHAVFADEQTLDPRQETASAEIGDDAVAAPLDTAYQRPAWMRMNEHKLVDPVKEYWNSKCAVLGIESSALLQACHIKPFSASSDTERLDPFNDLCLAAHIHAAFDAELIGFSSTGEVVISQRLSSEDRKRMNLTEGAQIQVIEGHRPYLEYRYAKFLEANK